MISQLEQEVFEVKVKDYHGFYHYPVMYREVLAQLSQRKRKVVVDCTLGLGSLAARAVTLLEQDSLFVGIDRDSESLAIASQNLKDYSQRVILVQDNFSNLADILDKLNITAVDVFIFDLGISSYQLNNFDRGFSFMQDGPLDMRMDKQAFISAYDLVNNLSEKELENIFYRFGQERYSRRIAKAIVDIRQNQPISSTNQLAEIAMKAVPGYSRNSRIHPATRIFQALRIVTNNELECLKKGLESALNRLAPQGIVIAISFHSLEDRIVKHTFREFAAAEKIRIVTKKPLIPSDQEREENNPSRSAKLRVAEKI